MMDKQLKQFGEIIFYFAAAWLFYQGVAFALGTPMPIVSVVSHSMEPVLHKGDLLIVSGVPNPEKRDIVIYNPAGTKYTIVHRIIDVAAEGYVLKGDNNNAPDPAIVKKEQVIGKVWIAIPLLGYPRLALFSLGI